ncbi:Hpt domain-containing protein [Paracoccus versutus]|uniref:Hpt domain-containing protein n=1 Tax=Paracoccus versutus TaxID=34007 RepID=A0A099FMA8_PARVE|nr:MULTISPECIES: Hpt domain-containing protein [Paracoccus]WGR61032.1 Hpt domain-containing protein [Paracoccus ferrooxidans]SFX26634.1 Hpt domain-containing protein [Paracoccus pantotrophus]KGJ11421.1 histidine kinase [Paracoccus versutus]MBT0779885.1 Hpt domain-containing protein [Paracoccus sp. pheM1]MCJ1898856.1 Hpt domain-containing protein [Paracoccus versutus]
MLDWNRINELRGEVGDDEFQLILELFLDEVEGVIMRLSRRDVLQLETDLHFLKGCAWNLGFTDFGNLCDAGERKAAGGRAAEVDVESLLASYSASKQALMRQLDAALRPDRRARLA